VALTDFAFFRQLDRLRLRIRTARGHRPGETLIPRATQAWGVEFESYKEYVPGDDFRYVDWNAVGRLDQLMVRTFTAEREIPVHLFLDTSASMGAPVVDQKFTFATDLVSALGYIVLNNNDPLHVVALAAPKSGQLPFRPAPLLRHRSQFARLPGFLQTLAPTGRTYLRETVRAYIEQTREPGVAAVVSDFLVEPAQYEGALTLLQARGYEVRAIHIIGAAELAPERFFRRGKLYDVEEHGERWVSLSPTHLHQYQEALQAHLDALQQFCHRHQVLYSRATTDTPLAQIMTEQFTQVGFLAFR
jgi:uncharacterized protein (DUF58 family)